jgi:hypothetical protein
MKSISAAIIVLAGVAAVTAGSLLSHDQTRLFVQFVGCLVTGIGLFGWGLLLWKSSDDRETKS